MEQASTQVEYWWPGRAQERQLPETIAALAFHASNGDYAWRRADLPTVVKALAEHHYAVVSGEVWVVEGNLFCTLSPSKFGGWAIIAWEAPERATQETWDHFAHRAAEETWNLVSSLNPEDCVTPEVADKLYYHICFADEGNYPLLKMLVA